MEEQREVRRYDGRVQLEVEARDGRVQWKRSNVQSLADPGVLRSVELPRIIPTKYRS